MTKVSSITTEYSRTVQPAPYESQSAKVSVTLIEVEEDPNANATDALLEVQGIVHSILGLDAPAKKPKKSKPIAEMKGVKAKPAAKKATAPVKEEPTPDEDDIDLGDEAEEEAPKVQKGDLMKAIQAAKARLKSKGEADTATPLTKIIRAYVNKDEPPFNFKDIPDHAWGDFIYDLDKLGR